MQHIIASYLFQHKTCPLPGLGTLAINSRPAEYDFVNKYFLPPAAEAVFSTAETDAAALVDFIAVRQNCTVIAAIDMLGKFSNGLKQQLAAHGSAVIPFTGTLHSNADGGVVFEPLHLPAHLQPIVPAEKVIHPEAAHNMLVGDKETTTVQMAAYYNEEAPVKNYWWVWALVLFAVALTAVIVYYNQKGLSSFLVTVIPLFKYEPQAKNNLVYRLLHFLYWSRPYYKKLG